MRFSALAPRIFQLLLLSFVLIFAGCADEQSPLAPTQSQGSAELTDALQSGFDSFSLQDARGRVRPTLSNIWPNDDGRSWAYRIQERAFGGFLGNLRTYPTAAAVPPAPSLYEVAALLRWHPIGADPVLSSAGYRMRFNGIKTTMSGAVGQNLETMLFEEATPLPPEKNAVAAASSANAAEAVPGGFLRALSVARPDLASRIAARWTPAIRTASPSAVASVHHPLFLFGYAWEKTSEYIGSYGDLNTELSWKYLVSDLRPGSSFSMQLVPDLAEDVFLHARVLRDEKVVTYAGKFRHAVRVLYLVDFGVSAFTDIDGNVLGYSRFYSYGTIDYVPGVGPVAGYERGLVQPGRPLDPGLYDQAIGLVGTAPGSPIP